MALTSSSRLFRVAPVQNIAGHEVSRTSSCFTQRNSQSDKIFRVHIALTPSPFLIMFLIKSFAVFVFVE